MPVLENYYEHLYHGPVVSLRGYCAPHRLQGSILAYLDFGGATGSAKDGLAEGMLALAAEQGLLAKGQPRPSSGLEKASCAPRLRSSFFRSSFFSFTCF